MASTDTFDSNKYLQAINTSSGSTPKTSFNYDAFLGDINKAATSTAQVNIPDPAGIYKIAKKTFQPKYTPAGQQQRGMAGSLMADYQTKAQAMKDQAAKAATALEMKGAATVQSMTALEALQAQSAANRQSSADAWVQAAGKAEEYVADTRARSVQALGDMDRIFSEMNQGRDFAKAHSVQAGVQATIGAMDAELRQIRQGAKSPEDLAKQEMQFNQKKRTALGNMQSQIEVGYQQIAEEANKNYFNARADTATKMAMYSGFQEQQHVETLMGMAKSGDAYALADAQFQLTVEQLKMAGMDDMAGWIVSTPQFSVELAPLMAGMIGIADMYVSGTPSTSTTQAQQGPLATYSAAGANYSPQSEGTFQLQPAAQPVNSAVKLAQSQPGTAPPPKAPASSGTTNTGSTQNPKTAEQMYQGGWTG